MEKMGWISSPREREISRDLEAHSKHFISKFTAPRAKGGRRGRWDVIDKDCDQYDEDDTIDDVHVGTKKLFSI